MSCHGCAIKFNFFNRENGCPNCGFSYCNKCLKYKSIVSQLGNSKVNVCKQCYETLTEGTPESSSTMKQYSPPAAFLRRMESLENPARPPITMYRHDKRMQQLKSGLEQPDQEIADRLEKLREERKKAPVPSDDEVAQRLAQLRGEDPAATRKHPIYEAADRRTDEEKTHDLMKQYTAQQVLDSNLPNLDEEIAVRLAKLRVQSNAQIENITSTSNNGGDSRSPRDPVSALLEEVEREMKDESSDWTDIEKAAQASLKDFDAKVKTKTSKNNVETETGAQSSDDEETMNIISKVCEEAAMEAKMEEMELEDGLQDTQKNDQVDESWCSICSEDAAIKCLDCNGTLYCSDPECFLQEHDAGIMHKTVPFHHQFK